MVLLASCDDAGCRLHAIKHAPAEPTTTRHDECVRLLFAGDAMCHSPQITAARQSDGSLDFRASFSAVKPYFERADISVINLETTISPDGRYSGYPTFSSPAKYAEALAWAGVDVALLANNHCCDRGAKGLKSTIATLDRLGVAHTGAFADSLDYGRNNVLRIERNGIKIAFVNYTYGTNGIAVPQECVVNLIDTVRMVADLECAVRGSDCVVACMHWGEEYSSKPSREQRKVADFLHRHGADVVVGSHPHVVQPAVSTGRSVTIYSLGNFISNQRKRYCDGGILAEVDIAKNHDGECRYSLKATPIWVALPDYRVLPPGDVANEFFAEPANKWCISAYEQFMYDTESLFVQGIE